MKNIRSKVDTGVIGHTIVKVREIRNGNVLIEVIDGSETAEVVRKEVEKTLRPGESARSLEQRTLIQIRDLDCATIKQEVVEAVQRDYGVNPEDAMVLNIRPIYGGEQATVLLIPLEVTHKDAQ